MSEDKKPSGPDLTQGVLPADFNEDKLLGHVAYDEVLLVQVGAEVLAINPYCSHYHGPLAEGLVVEDTIRCPWHHACFSLRTGEATRPPALSSLSVWQVERGRGKDLRASGMTRDRGTE
jgi:nitrite reductase/ring-hydroxylating ferredoxin subunit